MLDQPQFYEIKIIFDQKYKKSENLNSNSGTFQKIFIFDQKPPKLKISDTIKIGKSWFLKES